MKTPPSTLSVSVTTVASSASTSIASISREKPWPSSSTSSMAPRGLRASNWSAWRHSRLERGFRGNCDRNVLIEYPAALRTRMFVPRRALDAAELPRPYVRLLVLIYEEATLFDLRKGVRRRIFDPIDLAG